MEPLQINLVRKGKYIGITDGKKVITIRDAEGVATPAFSHLVPTFESGSRSVDLSVDDFLMLRQALEESLETIVEATDPVDVPTDGVRDGDRDIS